MDMAWQGASQIVPGQATPRTHTTTLLGTMFDKFAPSFQGPMALNNHTPSTRSPVADTIVVLSSSGGSSSFVYLTKAIAFPESFVPEQKKVPHLSGELRQNEKIVGPDHVRCKAAVNLAFFSACLSSEEDGPAHRRHCVGPGDRVGCDDLAHERPPQSSRRERDPQPLPDEAASASAASIAAFGRNGIPRRYFVRWLSVGGVADEGIRSDGDESDKSSRRRCDHGDGVLHVVPWFSGRGDDAATMFRRVCRRAEIKNNHSCRDKNFGFFLVHFFIIFFDFLVFADFFFH